ncbi:MULTISPECIES: MFS transporter [unclassified Oceanispirochaeta]|uniref:MFS transporter n=1 Tax=unclassified Oceanispirochaeta TaxID=2635722 RepID=UPI000E09C28D|nr:MULTISPECIES: MFS transporter [unclassified Oceanispirochaeta]MBF9017315.1 MFS transporter [Oceanispirochaeta sp. M2]NPD73825.1 MFS transporter [Oceanispirochaeta sp. M1]RDG30425.1 MFS transporter [Oceanispirochaeta sp. M1]
MIDSKGKRISSARVERSLFISLIAGGMGSVWFIFCQPQQILTVMIRNYLHASDQQLGTFVAILNMAGVFHLGAIYLYSKTKRIKPVWIITTTLSRSSAFFIAAAALYVYMGGDKNTALWIVMGVSLVFSYMLGNISGSGWWTWISALIPEKTRSSYFGKRSSLAQMMNIIFFFSATWLLDIFSSDIFLIYALIYLVIGVLGVADILLHLAVPEPVHAHERQPFSRNLLLEPVRNKEFLCFAVLTGFSVLSIFVAAPFLAPHITSPETVGAPNIWLGIMFFISQLTWMFIAPFWGMLMDRMGQKPIVLLGLLHPFCYPLYLLLTPHNYEIFLPIIAIWTGIFAPAFWEGITQMMLAQVPSKNRTAYVAWYWALLGMIGSLGNLLGGFLMEHTGSLTITIAATLLLTFLSFLVFGSLKVTATARLDHVVSLITTPSVYRTYSQLSVLSGTVRPDKVHKALKDVKNKSGVLAFDEVCSRLEDPDRAVREEAAGAMGRIGTEAARDILIAQLNNPDSLVRPEAAAALGLMQDLSAIPPLIDALYTGDEEVQEEAALSLGKLKSEESVKALKQIIEEDRSQRVKVSSVEGIVHQNRLEAVEEIMKLWEQTSNKILKTQLSISLGNLIGNPGGFYRCVTGTQENRDSAIANLFKDIFNSLKKFEIMDSGYVSHIIKESLPAVEESFTARDFPESFSTMYTIILNLIFRKLEMMGYEGDAENAGCYLKEKDSLLFLGFHLYSRLEQLRIEKLCEPQPTDILLGVYFLKSYCKRETQRGR